MYPSVKRFYESAKKDEVFKEKYLNAYNTNKIPNFFTSDEEKILFAAYYYGYILGNGSLENPEVKNYFTELIGTR